MAAVFLCCLLILVDNKPNGCEAVIGWMPRELHASLPAAGYGLSFGHILAGCGISALHLLNIVVIVYCCVCVPARMWLGLVFFGIRQPIVLLCAAMGCFLSYYFI